MLTRFSRSYDTLVLARPVPVLCIAAAILLFFCYTARNFKLDASADSLLLEDDRDLQRYREISQRYGIEEFVVVTFSPAVDLFSPQSLKTLTQLRAALRELPHVNAVVSILDLPLLKNDSITLSQLSPARVTTLEAPGVDIAAARREIIESPIYRNYAISPDGQTTALLVKLEPDIALADALQERNQLLGKQRAGDLSPPAQQNLREVSRRYDRLYEAYTGTRHADLQAIRAVMQRFESVAEIHLGGVPMIADDMLRFIKNDLVVFGIGVFLFIVATLTIIFRQVRWVVLPLLSCFYAVVVMIGVLGACNWKVTVISSNFISLMLILTMSMNIHLSVRYRQLARDFPGMGRRELVLLMARKMFWPCLYTALTTILAFCSLVFSGIRPVIDFGWMMTLGLTVTFLTSFVLFPAVLVLLNDSAHTQPTETRSPFTALFASLAQHQGRAVLVCAVVLLAVSAAGIAMLRVENSFINYFQEDTEIYQGLSLIDDKLGGTTPLEVILHFGAPPAAESDDEEGDFGWVADYDPRDYWLTPLKVEKIKRAHDFLASLPEVGKVLSLASVVRVVEDINDGEPLDGLELGVLYKKIPQRIKDDVFNPYVSIEENEARLSLRILDSHKNIRRAELLQKISTGLTEIFAPTGETVTMAGLLVLYNNMLQSLFRSQILTLGIVLIGIALMLLVLFRSVALAAIGIVPNLLAVCIVLGIMGLAGIPLDMMTITIAAITMGIAIDNSIHYMYRYREEFARIGDYAVTVRVSHDSVGRAIVNTSVTIIFGFSILVFSNFMPTIYFGIFTGLAMCIAMLAVLILMPKLILLIKPFGSDTNTRAGGTRPEAHHP